MDLVDKNEDAHILYSGWREAGPGEWQCGSDQSDYFHYDHVTDYGSNVYDVFCAL